MSARILGAALTMAVAALVWVSYRDAAVELLLGGTLFMCG